MISTYLTWCYTRVEPVKTAPDGHGDAEVILDQRPGPTLRSIDYLIKWEGYDVRYTSWVNSTVDGYVYII
jgi:hypothetical protein